jgi:sec-independent protein translocase protein TatA
MGELSPWHWLIVLGVVVLLFGAKRLPDAARSLGRSARILQAEMRAGTAPPAVTEPDPGRPENNPTKE